LERQREGLSRVDPKQQYAGPSAHLHRLAPCSLVLPKTRNGYETIFKKRQIKAAKKEDGFISIQYV